MSESNALRKAAELTREKFAHFNEVMGYTKKCADKTATSTKPTGADTQKTSKK